VEERGIPFEWSRKYQLNGSGRYTDPNVKLMGVYCGVVGGCNVHQRGLYVAADGKIIVGNHEIDPEWVQRRRTDFGLKPGQTIETRKEHSYAAIFDRDGRLITANAVGDLHNGHGIAMDRQGNIYAVLGQMSLEGPPPYYETAYFGIAGGSVNEDSFGRCGVLVKFPGRGGRYPLGGFSREPAPGATQVKVRENTGRRSVGYIHGAEWVYSGIPNATWGCSCAHVRWDMDYYPRLWIPADHLCSVVVLDSNGNLIVRFGRYGNVDDGDPESGGIRFAGRIRAVGVSDTAFYAVDQHNHRLLKAALFYAAEETVAIP
jgi:hypothetical protein